MSSATPIFATGTRVAGAVLVAGYVSGLVPGAVVSLVGGLALITFGRALMLDRSATAVSGASLAVIAGALGIAALRWGSLSLGDIVGAQSVLGPSVAVGPVEAAVSSIVALVAAVVALAAWATEPAGTDRPSRMWSRVEVVLGVIAAVLVFAAPGSGGSLTGLIDVPEELAITAGALVGCVLLVLLAPRLLGSRKVRWIVIVISGAAVIGAASVVASAL